ncbi:MAG: helix-turn-helix transcriptional regulator [Candidatus Omnitrophica bacterium]|nr:helix-turn-helix transcriptional regulator [Candidatus Omnitrophota bacterium]
MAKIAKSKFKTLDQVMQKQVKGDPERELNIQVEQVKIAVAEQLVEIREKTGLTQKQLAQKMGVSQQLISRIESGSDNLTLETLVRFLSVLGVVMKVEVDKKKGREQVLQFV